MRTIICVVGAVLVLALGMGASGCSNVVPLGPTSATDPSPPTPTPAPGPSHAPTPTPTPTPPPTETVSTVAYTPDLQPVFASDCVPCHNDRSAAGRYSMSTYAGVMRAVRAGSALSPLVVVTAPGGLMYGFSAEIGRPKLLWCVSGSWRVPRRAGSRWELVQR